MNTKSTMLDGKHPLPTKRSLAPDLARGFMLLLIALAHAPMYVPSSGTGVLNHPIGGDFLDNFAKFMTILFIDLRSYPMFAALFGFGLAMIITRRLAKGASKQDAKKIIYRRCLYLLLFGLLHVTFVFSYDILSLYGIAGLLIGWLIFKSDQSILRGAAWFSGLFSLMLILLAIATFIQPGQPGASHNSMIANFFGDSILLRLTEFPTWLLYCLLAMPLISAILFGAWAQKKELLEQPAQNRSLLWKVTIIGISVSVIGGLPFALAGAEIWTPPATLKGVLIALHTITGLFGGLGYTAMFGLISLQLAQKQGLIVRALASIGRRSLTCYLAQSIILAILLANWGFGFGKYIHSASAAVIGLLIWLVTVIFAFILEQKGKQGPAEAILRRLIYKDQMTGNRNKQAKYEAS